MSPSWSGAGSVRVGFAYDLFRSPALGQWDPRAQTRWLQAFLTPAIELAGGTARDALGPVVADADAWIRAQLAGGHLPPGAAGWAVLYGGALPPGAEHWSTPMLGFDLVVGYEMSPNQLRFLARHGTPFLDIGIDAVRFARRALFRGRSNDPRVRHALQHAHVPDAALAADAGFLRATCGGGQPGPAEDLVFAGQVDTDGSLVVGGRIERITPHLPHLAALAAGHRRVLVHPHPLASANRDVRAVLAAIPNAVLAEGGIYPTLADARTRTVATLSSSVAAEAELLGKVAVRLIVPDGGSAALGPDVVGGEVRLDSGIAHAGFWDTLFGGNPVRPFPGHGPEESLLRSALGIFVAGAAPGPPLQAVAPGGSLSLADPVNVGLCRLGWSGLESHGRWTDGPVAVFAMELAGPCAGLVLSLHAFMGSDPRPLNVRLTLVAGDLTAGMDVRFDDDIPRDECLEQALPPGPLTVKLHMDDPRSPASQGLSADDRALGVQVTALRFLPQPAPP